MGRVSPAKSQKKRLLEANANRCCVCKRKGVGLHLHHIDEDSSNTVDENLAVLCVEDHDRHHRPGAYKVQVNHLELSPEQIRKYKKSWEAFVTEARQPFPKVAATLAFYGTYESIHAFQLVLQWPDERIEYTRSYHLLEAHPEKLIDEMLQEVKSLGPKVKLMQIDEPLPVEHCPCGGGYSRTLKPAAVLRSTDPDWLTHSFCSIYINPKTPRITFTFFLRDKELFLGTLHLCQERFLHLHSEYFGERVEIQPKPSVRAQATRMIEKVLKEWTPAHVFVGTGNPDEPNIIEGLNLPSFWERRSHRNRKPTTPSG